MHVLHFAIVFSGFLPYCLNTVGSLFSKIFGIVKYLIKVSIEITIHLGSLTGGNEIVKTPAVKTLWIRKKSES